MKHSVLFDRVDTSWDTALPLGNGVFGAMVFYRNGVLSMPMNHYEVYYSISDSVLPKDKLSAKPPFSDPGRRHADTEARAYANMPEEGEPYISFRKDKRKDLDSVPFGGTKFASRHPATGEAEFRFSDALKGGDSRLVLFVEDGKIPPVGLSYDDLVAGRLAAVIFERHGFPCQGEDILP